MKLKICLRDAMECDKFLVKKKDDFRRPKMLNSNQQSLLKNPSLDTQNEEWLQKSFQSP